jgi:hypothetical protein
VYADDANTYIAAFPSMITADGYVYVNMTSKTYGGSVDLRFGFADKLAYPIKLEVYSPKTEAIQHQLNLSSFSNQQRYRITYNYTRVVGQDLFDGYVTVDSIDSLQS